MAGDVDKTAENNQPKKSFDKNNSDSDGFSIEKSETRSREVSDVMADIDNRIQSDD